MADKETVSFSLVPLVIEQVQDSQGQPLTAAAKADIQKYLERFHGYGRDSARKELMLALSKLRDYSRLYMRAVEHGSMSPREKATRLVDLKNALGVADDILKYRPTDDKKPGSQ